ncbi:Phenylacetate-coenzyme A ligase [Desulfosporosinus sp. BG]|nr:Phenylacetate-coenzyme A ligase [Desulfosporosinus sp. BG]
MVDNLDTLEIWVEMSQNMFLDKVRKIEELEVKIRKEIVSTWVEPKTIERSEGKAKRVIDKRRI